MYIERVNNLKEKVYNIMREKINIDNYWPIADLNVSKKEAIELFGNDLITYKRKVYIPKDICPSKILKYLKNHGDVEWKTDPLLLNIH